MCWPASEQGLHQNTTVIFKLTLQRIPMAVVTDVAYPLNPQRLTGNPPRSRPALTAW